MIPVETPLGMMDAPTIKGKKLVFASILRAGNGLLDGMLDLVPAARVAHIGIYRDHETLQPVEYYFKAPAELEPCFKISDCAQKIECMRPVMEARFRARAEAAAAGAPPNPPK